MYTAETFTHNLTVIRNYSVYRRKKKANENNYVEHYIFPLGKIDIHHDANLSFRCMSEILKYYNEIK